jgi:hypothetical protein
MPTAAKGRRFEHEVRELFRQAGYSVIRGAGSKGELLEQKLDLGATKATRQNKFACYVTIWSAVQGEEMRDNGQLGSLQLDEGHDQGNYPICTSVLSHK